MNPGDAALDAAHALRELPSVDHVLRLPAVATLTDEFPRDELRRAVRAVLEERRRRILAGGPVSAEAAALALDVRAELHRRARPSLRRVINATGVVLHTGLGRAPLAEEALEAVADAAAAYSNLEFDLPTGDRGDRHAHVRGLLTELTGAEDALVVNNNAAATYLALNTLACGFEVLVSRGQLVEIGGSYRMPDIMAAAGCVLVEVGTTNRTRVADYRLRLGDRARVLLRVHTSNYRIVGFTESVGVGELVALARTQPSLPLAVVDDLGSGLLDAAWAAGAATGAWDEPTVRDSVAAGVDLAMFSGDKLLGGPQAGIVVGRAECVARLRKNPLMRAVRPDKMTLAALEATLRLYRDPAALSRRLPVLRMLTAGLEALETAARRLADALARVGGGIEATAGADESFAGGGALPALALPTRVVQVRVAGLRADALAAALRLRDPPVVCRLRNDALIIDCRTLLRDDEEQLVTALAEVLREASRDSGA